jgi:hypothetical protein
MFQVIRPALLLYPGMKYTSGISDVDMLIVNPAPEFILTVLAALLLIHFISPFMVIVIGVVLFPIVKIAGLAVVSPIFVA